MLAGLTASPAQNRLELLATGNFHKTGRDRASNCQAGTSSGATGIDDRTTSAGFHANPESVGALALGHGRLVSTLHDGCLKPI